MNLLSHFACARTLPPEVQAGSAMGDLLPLYRRRVRPLALMTHWAGGPERPPALAAVAEGIRFHLHVDSRFHRDPLFLEPSRKLGDALRRASDTPGLKRFFPAHILTEMFLDHLLMAEDPGLVGAFYDLFDGEMRGLLARFVVPHAEADPATFARFLVRFGEDRFLEDYRDPEGILQRAGRLLERFGQRPLEAAERRAVRDVFDSERMALRGRLLQFVAAMRDADWNRSAAPEWATASRPDRPALSGPG